MKKSMFKAMMATVILAFAMQGAAFAKAKCKGMEEGKCSAAKECKWVKEYAKKDGKKVAAHCKSKSKKKKAKKEETKK